MYLNEEIRSLLVYDRFSHLVRPVAPHGGVKCGLSDAHRRGGIAELVERARSDRDAALGALRHDVALVLPGHDDARRRVRARAQRA